MKKTRLLLINNPITALWMAAWHLELERRGDDGWRNVAVYCFTDCDLPQYDGFERKKPIYEAQCRTPVATFVDDWVVCMPTRLSPGSFDVLSRQVLHVARERRTRRKEIESIRRALAEARIDPDDVAEIWRGNGKYDQHISWLCPASRGVQFEHGISDVRNAIVRNTTVICSEVPLGWCPLVLIRPLRALREALNRRAVLFSRSTVKCDQHVSLLGEGIGKANAGIELGSIQPRYIGSVCQRVMEHESGTHALASVAQSVALVLVESLQSQAGKEDTLAFYEDLDQYLWEHCSELFNKASIRSILFKTRFFHRTYAEEGVARMSRLGAKYKCLLISDFSPLNYPVEYYLSSISPKIMIASHSSSLFYCKRLSPGLATYSYHRWYLNRCAAQFGQGSDVFRWLAYELGWQEDVFHQAYRECFKGEIPELLPL